MENFYSFSSKLTSSTTHAHAISLSGKEDINGLSDEHRLIQGVYNGISFPVVFRQEYGRKLEDILDTGWPSLYLISDKMKTALEQGKLTGWKAFAVEVWDKQGSEIKGYYGLSITGRCGKIDYKKSEVIEKRLVPDGPFIKYYKGLHIGLEEWDGTDFFLPEKYFGIVTTQRVAEALKKNKLSNIRFENLAEIETDYSTVQVALQNQE